MRHLPLHNESNTANTFSDHPNRQMFPARKWFALYFTLVTTLLICICLGNSQALPKKLVRIGFLEYAVFDVSIEDTKVAINLYFIVHDKT